MSIISLQARQDFTKVALDSFARKKLEIENDDEFVMQVYNDAIGDALDAIEVYANKNPQYYLEFTALRKEMGGWMPLVREDETS